MVKIIPLQPKYGPEFGQTGPRTAPRTRGGPRDPDRPTGQPETVAADLSRSDSVWAETAAEATADLIRQAGGAGRLDRIHRIQGNRALDLLIGR